MKLLNLLIFVLAVQTIVLGQGKSMHAKGVSYEKVRSNFVVIDKGNLSMFNTQQGLDEIRCVYFNGVLKHVLLKQGTYSDFYDLTFVADSLAFLYKFGKVNINLPIEKLDSLKSTLDLHACMPFETLDVFIRHDSTIFDYSLRCLEVDLQKINANRQIGYAARFVGDLNIVKNKIASECKDITVDAEESIVFQVKIDSKGVINDLKLEVGSQSAFSESVRRHLFERLSDGVRRWKPAIVYSSGREVGSKMRMYAKLCKDGSIEVLTNPRLFTFD